MHIVNLERQTWDMLAATLLHAQKCNFCCCDARSTYKRRPLISSSGQCPSDRTRYLAFRQYHDGATKKSLILTDRWYLITFNTVLAIKQQFPQMLGFLFSILPSEGWESWQVAIVGDDELISRQMNFDQVLKHVEVWVNVMRSREGWISPIASLGLGNLYQIHPWKHIL